MKTLEDVIKAQELTVSEYVSDQKRAFKAIEELKQNWTDTLPDLPFSKEVKEELEDYLQCDSALELWKLDAFKALKKADFLNKKAEYLPLPEDNLTPEVIEKYRTVMESGIFVRKTKLAQNYDIAIGRAKEKLLLLRLLKATAGTPAEELDYYKDYLDAILSEKKSGKTPSWLPEVGMTLKQVLEHFGGDWGKAGASIKKAGLTVGQGNQLVKA